MDFIIFSKLNGLAFQSFWFDWLVVFFAKFLPYLLAGFLFSLLLWGFKKYLKPVVVSLLASGVGIAIAWFVRFLWQRVRPFEMFEVNLLFNHASNSAFPSMHATFFFAASAVLLVYGSKKLYPQAKERISSVPAILFFAASLLIVLSRVIAGLHWPSDILAGFGFGLLSALLVWKVAEKLFDQKTERSA